MKHVPVRVGGPLLIACLCLGCGSSPDGRAEPASAGADVALQADTLELPQTNYYEIVTPMGRLVVRLYDETPLHRDNFKRLVAQQAYDSTLFHRVIAGFMIQGGDPASRDDDDPMNDGQGGPGYTLPAEIRPGLFHKRGALAAARQGDPVNPERRSSGSQFYIVAGTVFPDSLLDEVEDGLRQQIPDPDFHFADSMRAVYTTEGGAPHLDGMYTVFGELVDGFDVLDRIAAAPTPRSTGRSTHPFLIDRPFDDIPMVVRPLTSYP